MMFTFLAADDPRWAELESGYRRPYNPLPDLRRLRDVPDDAMAWQRLWQALYHQGDIGTASYAAVAGLIELRRSGVVFNWNFYALIAAIEARRTIAGNPPLPGWLERSYRDLWADISTFCFEDMQTETDTRVVRAYLATLALVRGATELGQMLIEIDGSEIREWLDTR